LTHNLDFAINFVQQSEFLSFFKALKGRSVPLIFIGDKRIDGYNEALIRRELGL
jgi:hypothetical protein